MREICQNALQISTVPRTAEIFPCTVTRPALPAFCSSVEPTESNDPAYKRLLFVCHLCITGKCKLSTEE